jgi:hypothetical protein
MAIHWGNYVRMMCGGEGWFADSQFEGCLIGSKLEKITMTYDTIDLEFSGVSTLIRDWATLYVPCDGDVKLRGHNGFGSRCSADYLYRAVGSTVELCFLGQGIVRLCLVEPIDSRKVWIEFKWSPLVIDDKE